jgi:hypothetical protein
MNTNKRVFHAGAFLLQWILGNAVGWIVGMALFTSIGQFVELITQGPLLIIAWGIFGALAGAIVGVNQWIVLNLFSVPRGEQWQRGWIAATVVGWSFSLMVVVGMAAGEALGFTVSGAVIGIAVGISQWFVLHKHLKRAEWWGIANTIAWMSGMALLDLMDRAVGFALAGLVAGLITGLWLIWLFQRNEIES